jgi:hypothetical protein
MAIVRLERLGELKKIHLIGIRTRDFPACSIVPQPTTLNRQVYKELNNDADSQKTICSRIHHHSLAPHAQTNKKVI